MRERLIFQILIPNTKFFRGTALNLRRFLGDSILIHVSSGLDLEFAIGGIHFDRSTRWSCLLVLRDVSFEPESLKFRQVYRGLQLARCCDTMIVVPCRAVSSILSTRACIGSNLVNLQSSPD